MIIITGATSGIGEATARLFSQKGYDLYLLARRRDRLEKLKAELEGPNCKVQYASLDLCDTQAIQSWSLQEKESLKKTKALINNAGIALGMDPIQNGKIEDFQAMINTNVTGLLCLTRHILDFMIEAQQGHLIQISSVAGRWVYPKGAVYCATKAAVKALNEGLRLDLNGTGLRVTEIAPGMVETEFSEIRLGDKQKAKEVYQGLTPLTPEDIAESILWCFERPPHINIQELVVYPTDQASVTLSHRR